MMNNSPFDDHIKKKFGNYQPEVPPYIWENIIAEKKKRRPGAIVFGLSGKKLALLLVFIIAGGITTAILLNKKQTNNNSNTTSSSLKDNPGLNNTDNGLVPDKSAASNSSAVKSSTLDNNHQQAVNSTIPSQNATSTVAINNVDEPSQHAAASIVNSNHKKASTDTRNNKIDASGISNSADERMAISTKEGNIHAADMAAVNSKKSKLSGGRTRVSIRNATPDMDAETNETNIINENTNAQAAKEIGLNNYYLHPELIDFSRNFSFNVRGINMPGMNIPCPGTDKKGRLRNRYVELYAGPDYVFRSFSDTANSVYKQKRKESTKFSSAFSFGLRYTKLFNNNVSIRAGINYSQVNEKFNYEQGHIVQTVNIYDENGNVIGSYATTSTRYKTTYNRYHAIDIPVTVGYEMGNDRLRANINAGVVLNIYSWQKGDLLDYNYEPVNITTGKSSSPYQFKTNTGLGLMAGASVYYRLTGRLHLMAEPYIRYNFSAANKADITLKQKFTTAGLRLGLRIDF